MSDTIQPASPRESRQPKTGGRSVLVFRIGSLGDTLVSVPALWAVRQNFPNSRITLLSDRQVGRTYVLAGEVLRGCGAVDDFMSYPVGGGRMRRMLELVRLVLELRRRRYDAVVYLAPTARTERQMARDRRFFRAAGIRRMIGMSTPPAPAQMSGAPLRQLPSEADQLMERLARDGLAIPPAGLGKMDLTLGDAEEAAVSQWLGQLPSDGGRKWIAVGPGAKMPVKVWPAERYRDVVAWLIEEFDVWPVVFGGPEDRTTGDALLSAWGRGFNAAGLLAVRPAMAAMRRCRLYLGNDTGTMHMAAAAGAKVVAVFSSHSPPGLWYPYGRGHQVLRTQVECEGCGLQVCVEKKMQCILSITPETVTAACRTALATI